MNGIAPCHIFIRQGQRHQARAHIQAHAAAVARLQPRRQPQPQGDDISVLIGAAEAMPFPLSHRLGPCAVDADLRAVGIAGHAQAQRSGHRLPAFHPDGDLPLEHAGNRGGKAHRHAAQTREASPRHRQHIGQRVIVLAHPHAAANGIQRAQKCRYLLGFGGPGLAALIPGQAVGGGERGTHAIGRQQNREARSAAAISSRSAMAASPDWHSASKYASAWAQAAGSSTARAGSRPARNGSAENAPLGMPW